MNGKSPLISVIVPVYNREALVSRAIRCVLGQYHRPLELILVDDGSTDGTGDICDRFAQSDDRVRVIHKANGGVSTARNQGIDAARGEYIGFMDSDDFIVGSYYHRMYRAMLDSGADVCKCSNFACDESFFTDGFDVFRDLTEDVIISRLVLEEGVSDAVGLLERLANDEVSGNCWGMLLHRSILDSGVRFRDEYAEDTHFNVDVALVCHKVCYLSDCFYYYLEYDGADRETSMPRYKQLIKYGSFLIRIFHAGEQLHSIVAQQKACERLLNGVRRVMEYHRNDLNLEELAALKTQLAFLKEHSIT